MLFLTAVVLAASAAATPPIVVAYNADDDNGNGVRDCQEPHVRGDDDYAPLTLPAGEQHHLLVDDAPAGAVKIHTGPDGLSVEARQPACVAWDGRFTILVSADGKPTERIPGRVAPLVAQSSLEPAQTVFVREFPGRNDRLVEQLSDICEQADAELHIVPAGEPYAYNHIWLQDTVEFLETKGAAEPLTVALAGVRNRALDLFARDRLLGAGSGYVQVGEYRKRFAEGEGGVSWIDWFGNLEASPPTESRPNGCILYGVDEAREAQLHPEVVAFLGAQGEQSLVALDVGWLTIKHVDEMVSFVPAKDGGFFVLVPDPTEALRVLRAAKEDGHGAAALLDVFEDGTTIDAVLEDADFVAANEQLWRERIEPMSKVLLDGVGVSVSRLRRMPVLFHPSGTPRTPNVVNCLVLPGKSGSTGHIAMADPNGPVVDGVDLLQAATREALADVAATIHFVDDRQYHKWSGNVHCATNAIRPIDD